MHRKMLCNKILLLFWFTISCITINATGPSYVHATIKPVSINAKGEILCRTRFVRNLMGAHDLMPVEYGLCVLTPTTNEIKEFQTFTVNHHSDHPEMDFDIYLKYYTEWENWFKKPFNFSQILEKEKPTVEEYGFSETNIGKYLRNDTIPLSCFENQKGVDLTKTPQKALREAKGYYTIDQTENKDKSNTYVIVRYDFGNILLLEHLDWFDPKGSEGEIEFDYASDSNYLIFETFEVTGVLFLQ